MSGRQTIRAVTFCSLVVAIFALLNVLYLPVWRNWHNHDTFSGFYEQPEETIQAIFLGASIMEDSVDAAQLYAEHGICGYNLASQDQPVMVSYYWTREAHRLHGSTLRTVVLDCSMLRRVTSVSFYQMALDGMPLSEVKLEAMADIAHHSLGLSDADPARSGFYDGAVLAQQLSHFFPMLAYHDRWESLTQDDFEDFVEQPESAARGFNFATGEIVDAVGAEGVAVPAYESDPEAGETVFETEELYYLRRLEEFCRQEGLQLVLVKTPGLANWGEANHNAAQALADAEGLPFIDFNFDPYFSESGYVEATDSLDGWHPNWRGGQKVTAWLGNYLARECGIPDVRSDSRYDFMAAEYEEAEYLMLKRELDAFSGPAKYLRRVMDLPGCVTFVSVADDGATEMTAQQRRIFRQLGLPLLGSLRPQAAYLAMIQEGEVVYEATKLSPYDEAWQLVGAVGEEPAEGEPAEGMEALPDGEPADVVGEGTEPAGDSTSPAADASESDEQPSASDEPADESPATDAEAAEPTENLDETSPNDLTDIDELYTEDLAELAELLASTDYESELDPLIHEGMLPDGNTFSLVSGGYYNGNRASVSIAGAERCPGGQGINIVTYDLVRHRVVDATCFNTATIAGGGRDTWDQAIEAVAQARAEGSDGEELYGRAWELFVYLRRCDDAWRAVYAPWELEAEEPEGAVAEGEAADVAAAEGVAVR